MFRTITNSLRGFAQDTRGSVSVEFILAMPMVFWAFMGANVYFDGYRQSSVNLKAAYTISDLLSRETIEINDTYVDSMFSLLQVLTRTNSVVEMRISVLSWDESDGVHHVDWSKSRSYGDPLTDASVALMADKLPVMPDNERVILVETRNIFVPIFNVGMTNKTLENFVFSRPRFAPQLVFDNNPPSKVF